MQLTLSSCSLSADNLINVGSLQHQYIANISPMDHQQTTDISLTLVLPEVLTDVEVHSPWLIALSSDCLEAFQCQSDAMK